MEVHYLKSVPSTNSALLEMSKKSAKSWVVCWTDNQTQGRGYAGNKWNSNKGDNLAVSFLIKSKLSHPEMIYFNQWLCNVVCHFLSEFSNEVFVKWPNDIIIGNKKVCGILIETYKSDNQLNIISGMGLNINQNEFPELPKAGSLFTQNGEKYNIEEILSGLLTNLENSYPQIENEEWEKISLSYNQNLFRKNLLSKFIQNKNEFEGFIRGVNDNGQLIIENTNGETECFQHKEIELVY